MKYLRHIEKQFLVPYTLALEGPEWEVYEEPGPHDAPVSANRPAEEPKPRKKAAAKHADE